VGDEKQEKREMKELVKDPYVGRGIVIGKVLTCLKKGERIYEQEKP